uniref:Uncharacterized protein n=1 Tax=Zea mays TaxID=4577 RepID=C4J606_MAIZE|nr:unknown [Zea mays]
MDGVYIYSCVQNPIRKCQMNHFGNQVTLLRSLLSLRGRSPLILLVLMTCSIYSYIYVYILESTRTGVHQKRALCRSIHQWALGRRAS